MKTYIEQVINRLTQLANEVQSADFVTGPGRLSVFKQYCENTSIINEIIKTFPKTHYKIAYDLRQQMEQWPTDELEGLAYRWAALCYAVSDKGKNQLLFIAGVKHGNDAPQKFFTNYLLPLYHHIIHQLETPKLTLYLLTRYKRLVEWFEAPRLRESYQAVGAKRC